MNKRRHTKLVREGQYAVEVEVELIEAGDDWSPYPSLDDAHKLDDVREAFTARGHSSGIRSGPRVHPHTPLGVSDRANKPMQPARLRRAADSQR